MITAYAITILFLVTAVFGTAAFAPVFIEVIQRKENK